MEGRKQLDSERKSYNKIGLHDTQEALLGDSISRQNQPEFLLEGQKLIGLKTKRNIKEIKARKLAQDAKSQRLKHPRDQNLYR